MPRSPHPLPRLAAAHGRQRGIYALEWAIIFPVFFMLLYAIVSFGLSFLVRESMQFAVEEGARAALRYPVGQSSATWVDKKNAALASIQRSLEWLPTPIRPDETNVKFTVCRLNDIESSACTYSTPLQANLICDISTPCLVLISYAITDYQKHAIAPGIPGLGLVLPSTLRASSSLLIDRRML